MEEGLRYELKVSLHGDQFKSSAARAKFLDELKKKYHFRFTSCESATKAAKTIGKMEEVNCVFVWKETRKLLHIYSKDEE